MITYLSGPFASLRAQGGAYIQFYVCPTLGNWCAGLEISSGADLRSGIPAGL